MFLPKIKVRFSTSCPHYQLMMSCLVSGGGYLMRRPVSSTCKYADRIMDYAEEEKNPSDGTPRRSQDIHFPSLFISFFFSNHVFRSESCTHLLPLFADLHVTPCDGFQVRRLHPSPRRPTSNLMPLPFSFFCRFWIRELLPARGASDHVVREPAVRRPRGLRGSAVRGSSARYLGEGRFQLLRFRVHSWSRSRSPVSRDCPKSAKSKMDRRMNFARLRRVQ